MPLDELLSDTAAGAAFWGYEAEGMLAGVMGFQPVRDVDLIRHAYVLPGSQRQRAVNEAASGCHFWLERRHVRRSVAGCCRVVISC